MTGRGSGVQAGRVRREEARVGRHGCWTTEDSVSAENCQKSNLDKRNKQGHEQKAAKSCLKVSSAILRWNCLHSTGKKLVFPHLTFHTAQKGSSNLNFEKQDEGNDPWPPGEKKTFF